MSGELSLSQIRYSTTNNDDLVIGDATNGPAHTSKYIVFQTDDVPGFYGHPHIKCFWDAGDSLWHLAFSEDGIVASEFARLASNNTFTANNFFYGSSAIIGTDSLDTLVVNSSSTFNGPTTFNDSVAINGDIAISSDNIVLNSLNVDIKDKLLALNHLGSAGSGYSSGIGIEEAGGLTGWVKTSSDRLGWVFKAPATSGESTFVFDSADQSYGFPDKSGTVALLSDLISNRITIVNQEYYTFLSTAYPYDVPHIQLFAAGGTTPYTWSIVAGDDTTWLAASVTGDVITGAIPAPGTYTVKVQCIDPNAVSDVKILKLEVSNAAATSGGGGTGGPTPPPALVISNQDLYSYSTDVDPSGTPYAVAIDLSATGGVPPYSWSVIGTNDTITSPAISVVSGVSKLTGTLAAWDTIYSAEVEVTDSLNTPLSKIISATVVDSTQPASIISFTGRPTATAGSGSGTGGGGSVSTFSVVAGTSITLKWSYSGTISSAVLTRSVGGAMDQGNVATASSGQIVLSDAEAPTATTVYTLTVNGTVIKTVTVTMNSIQLRVFSTKSYFTAGGSTSTVFAALASATGSVGIYANTVSGSPITTLTLSTGDTYTPGGAVAALFNDSTWKEFDGSKYVAAKAASGLTVLRGLSSTIDDYKVLGYIHGAEAAPTTVSATTNYIFVYNEGTATETRANIYIRSYANTAPIIGQVSQTPPRTVPTNPTGNIVLNGVPTYTGNLTVPNFPIQTFDAPLLTELPATYATGAGTGFHQFACYPTPIYDSPKGSVVMREGSETGPILGTLWADNVFQPLTGYTVPTTSKEFYFILTDNSARTNVAHWTFTVTTTAIPNITQFTVDHSTINVVNAVYDFPEISFTCQWANGGTGVLYANNVSIRTGIVTSATPFTITSPTTNTVYKLVITGTGGNQVTSVNLPVSVVFSTQTANISNLIVNPPAYLVTRINSNDNPLSITESSATLTAKASFTSGTCAYLVDSSNESGALLNNINKQIATNATGGSPWDTKLTATVSGVGISSAVATTTSTEVYKADFNAATSALVIDGVTVMNRDMTLSGFWRNVDPFMPWGTQGSDPSFTIWASPGTSYLPGNRTAIASGTLGSFSRALPALISDATTTYVAQVTASFNAYPDGIQTFGGVYRPSTNPLTAYNNQTVVSAPITTVVSTIYSARPTTSSSSGTGFVVSLSNAYDSLGKENTLSTVAAYKNQSRTAIFQGFASHIVPEYSPSLSAGGTIIIRGTLISSFDGSIVITVAVSGQADIVFTYDNSDQTTLRLEVPIAKTLNVSSAVITGVVIGPSFVGVPSTWVASLQISDILYVDSPGESYIA